MSLVINIDKIIAFFTDSDSKTNAMSIIASYTVIFDKNTGTGATMPNQEISYNVSTSLSSNTYTKDGNIFGGWNTKPDGSGTSYTNGDSVLNLGDTTLYAQWILDSFNITYNLNDGTLDISNPTTYTSNTETFTLNNPTKTGYTFKGWSGTDLIGDENTTVTITQGSTGDRSYTANYTANTYYVRFNSNGGSGSMSNQTMTYDTASNLTANNFARTGFIFKEWNTVSNGTGESYDNRESVSNLTEANGATIDLYAQWEAQPTKYAVQIYGINQDVDACGNTLGLTFGPAVRENYNNAYVTHKYEKTSDESEEYYVKIVTHKVASNGNETITEEYLTDSNGNNVTRTSSEKERYDLNLHEMTWSEIKGVTDKENFIDCMLCGDTKSVILTLNSTIASTNGYNQYGDGAGSLNNNIDEYYKIWNPDKTQNSAIGTNINIGDIANTYGPNAASTYGYKVSHIRATLNGTENSNPVTDYAGDINLTEDTCLYSCIQSDLRNIITAKKINYVTGSSTSTYNLNNDIADKIWLFSERELYGNGERSGYEVEGISTNGIAYRKFTDPKSRYYISDFNRNAELNRISYDANGTKTQWWSRSVQLSSDSSILYFDQSGKVSSRRANGKIGIGFGFCIQ